MGSNTPEPRRARILKSEAEIGRVLAAAEATRYPLRNRLVVLLAFDAGLRMSEIARLTRGHLLDEEGRLRACLILDEEVSRRTPGRSLALVRGSRLVETLKSFALAHRAAPEHPLITSERGRGLSEDALRYLLYRLFRQADLKGCSSFSGRRSYIDRVLTRAAGQGRSLRESFQESGLKDLGSLEPYGEARPRKRHQLDLFS